MKLHDLDIFPGEFETIFDIKPLKGIDEGKQNFARMMFHRRHVFEHNAGIVDERYIEKSGDDTLKLGQSIRETKANVTQFSSIIMLIAKNISDQFQTIIQPNEDALKMLRRK